MQHHYKMEQKNETEKVDENIVETMDFNKPNFEFIPKGVHEWRQQGYYLLCKSCELEHAVWIGADHIMVGVEDNGQPILRSRT